MDELYPKWPGTDKFWDWDMWMRIDGNRKGKLDHSVTLRL